MYDPPQSDMATSKLALPYLVPAQAQKEFTVNESLAILDAAISPVVEAILDDPPPSPSAGQSWLVGHSPTGAWQGKAHHIATWQGDRWILNAPWTGSTLYDRSAGHSRLFDGAWSSVATIADPTAGQTVDVEARDAIVAILQALRANGTIPRV